MLTHENVVSDASAVVKSFEVMALGLGITFSLDCFFCPIV